VKLALTKFRRYYQNEYVDYMGGEPTLHPQIVEIIRYSSEIGIKPTPITHGMRLADRSFAEALRDAGVHDFLVSVHGVGDTLNKIHRRGTGNFEKQQAGLENLRALGVPFRFNTTVVRDNLPELPGIARLAVGVGALVVNFLTFNPHFEWANEDPAFQVRHSDAAPQLQAAIDILTAGGVEANVRYMPLCTMRGYEEHLFTGYQLPYDTHEWDYNSWYDAGAPGTPSAHWYRDFADGHRKRLGYEHASPCEGCSMRAICDGIHGQYARRFGVDELNPYDGRVVTSPTHFIAHQPVVATEVVEAPGAVDHSLASALQLTQFREDTDYRAAIRVQPVSLRTRTTS
jgi:hypothetical protein